jgi:Domain of unknown function (DUF4375)
MNSDIAAQKALDRLAENGFEALTEAEGTLATVWLFTAGVQNHGFLHYFASKRGDLAFNAPAALRVIGATRLAEIAAEANAVFGDRGPPRDRQLRRNLVKALPESGQRVFDAVEQRHFSCDEDVDLLLENYLSRQKPSSK